MIKECYISEEMSRVMLLAALPYRLYAESDEIKDQILQRACIDVSKIHFTDKPSHVHAPIKLHTYIRTYTKSFSIH